MKKYVAAVLLCGVLAAAPGSAEESSIDLPVDLAVEAQPGDPAVEPSEDLAGEAPAAPPELPPLPTGFSLELFGGGTPFFVGDFDWAKGLADDFTGFESLAYAFGAGLTWFPPDYHNPYGFTMMLQFHIPTTVAWTFDGERYGNHRRDPGEELEAAELSLGFIKRIMVSPTGRFVFPVSVSLRAYYLDIRSDQSPDAIHYRQLNVGFNGSFIAEWHFSPQLYLFGRYTASVDVFSLALREKTTTTKSWTYKTAYYIDDREKQGFFYVAHSFSLGLGIKLKSLFKKKDIEASE
jgi:hypothetical protein